MLRQFQKAVYFWFVRFTWLGFSFCSSYKIAARSLEVAAGVSFSPSCLSQTSMQNGAVVDKVLAGRGITAGNEE